MTQRVCHQAAEWDALDGKVHGNDVKDLGDGSDL